MTAVLEPIRMRRRRDPCATRAKILEAACSLLSRDGPDGITLSAVIKFAGVSRSSAYRHFKSREHLVEATTNAVSKRIFIEVFGDHATMNERSTGEVDLVEVTERLACFAMSNPDLCRSWFLQVLSMRHPETDPFWRRYSGSIARFTQTDLAQPGVDAEVWSIILLAGNLLWPVWANAYVQNEDQRRALARRFARELLRLSMYGTLNASKFPRIASRLAGETVARGTLRAAG